MSVSEIWLNKSISSFEKGSNYQGIKEFNSSLARIIESNEFDKLEFFFSKIIPLLNNKSLYHEAEQIIEYYFSHLKKHKVISNGFFPIITIIFNYVSNESYSTIMLHIFTKMSDFVIQNTDDQLIDFLSENYENYLEKINNDKVNRLIKQEFFRIFVFAQRFTLAHKVAYPNFTKHIETIDEITYAMYSILNYAIHANISAVTPDLQSIRKNLPIEFQKEEIFLFCSDLLLAASGKDVDWFFELQSYYGHLLKKQLLRFLVFNLSKTYFPDSNKTSIFDLLR